MRVLRKDGSVLVQKVTVADSIWTRMRGLLGRDTLALQEALWITPCTSIHTFFMRFPIDVAFLDGQGRVIAFYPALRPWRLSGIHLRAAGVLEAAAGALQKAGVHEGEELCLSS